MRRAALLLLALSSTAACSAGETITLQARLSSQTGFPLVEWTGTALDGLDAFAVYRSDAGGPYAEVGRAGKLSRTYVDRFSPQDGVEYRYLVAGLRQDRELVRTSEGPGTSTSVLPDTLITDFPQAPLTRLNEADIKVAGHSDSAPIVAYFFSVDVAPRSRTRKDVIALRALSAGDHRVTVWAQDAAGNIDIAPPSIDFNVAVPFAPKLFVAQGAGAAQASCTRFPDVSLSISAEGAQEVKVSEDATLADAPWQAIPASRQLPFTLSSGEGPKVVFARFRSPEGAESLTVADTVFFDVTPPGVLITQPVPDTVTSHTTISILGTFIDASPITQPMINGAYGLTAGEDGFMRPFFPLAPGVNTIEVTITDCAGNATVSTVDVVRDPNAPAGNCGT